MDYGVGMNCGLQAFILQYYIIQNRLNSDRKNNN